MTQVTLNVNGKTVTRDVDDRTLLVEHIRRNLGLTGTHVGCDTTQCGACTIHLNGVATKSCTVLAVQADGSEVRTIESVADGDILHPLQQAFHEHHGLQCGYCTPGMIMIGLDILRRIPNPSEAEIRHNLEGNLCRCTGYHNIVKAIQAAAQTIAERRR
ncbi:(2Fe-2S)-binding protein [Ferrovibrio sp.]|uniref:(2Fe-2S)-binding protein n=1 Tax=Ferrovibrio sp. TaxID=1917215 RepID=UPI003D2A551C